MMEKMKDVNWQEEIRKIIIERVAERRRKGCSRKRGKLRMEMKSSKIAEMIREDRDAR